MKCFFNVVFLLIFISSIQGKAQVRAIGSYPEPDKEKLLKLSEKFHQRYLIRRAEMEKVAKERGWKVRQEDSTGVQEIMYLDKRGFPRVYQTTNINAGRTTNTDDIWQGGSTGLNLTGNGYIVAEWDVGGVRTTHQEFNNGAGSRVTQVDTVTTDHYHSTHVAGAIIAKGLKPNAHGMATEALLHAYQWTDDESEMAAAAADGLTLSNHSYVGVNGWKQDISGAWLWYGDTTISRTEDYEFGFYDDETQEWDDIAHSAPHYLIVKSAGNDRVDVHVGSHWVYNGSNWVMSTWPRDRDGGIDGYDCICQTGCAKNILTIGAVNDIPAGWVSPASVVQSAFSGWGPTDDGRIKPDLVANGVGVYSTLNTSDTSYASYDGTSAAAPNTTGTLVLLQDYYKSLRGGTMSAAALKGLVINTANEAGANPGPDYQNGWGLLNASGAANLITTDNSEGGQIVQGILRTGQSVDYTYYSNGASGIAVTICWTDPPGTPPAPSLNPPDLMLVNDLDVRLIKSGIYTLPWKLNPASPANAATRADNIRDNVEVINLANPSAGFYTIRISHKGALAGGQQAYAMIVSGMTTPPTDNYCTARSTNWNTFEYISRVTFGNIDHSSGRSPGGYHDFTGLVNKMTKGTTESLAVTIANGFSSDYARVWVDWNQDGDYTDGGETFNLGTGIGPVYTLNIPVPILAQTGYTTMRIRLNDGAYPSACETTYYGETEDYAIEVLAQCEAAGNGREYIAWVNAGTISNSSGSNFYSDYTTTHSTSLPANGAVHVTVHNGSVLYNEDQCGIWVDWNNNSSFLDAGEQIVVAGTSGTGPYTATIIPPEGISPGSYTMRIRITHTGMLLPCGLTAFGEVEDYKLILTAPVMNQWIGNTSHNWFEPLNWSLEHVPFAFDDVTINTGYTFNPVIPSGVATCNHLIIGAGAKISLGVADLEIGGDMTIMGQVDATSSSANYMVSGSVYWNAGSTANFTSGEFMVEGDWEFNSGASANLTNGTVLFTGSGNQYIRNYTAACSFNHLTNDKSAGILYISSHCSDTLKIKGNLRNSVAGSVLNCRSSHPVVLKGSFTNNGHIYCPYGTFIFGGTTHLINLNTGDYFNNLIIKSTGNTTLSDSLRIQGSLTISSGTLVAGTKPILVAGNWTNSIGQVAFNEGTGKVVFNGSGDQIVTGSEEFNILELNLGGKLTINNAAQHVTCNHYVWTTGGLEVQAGSFTAENLIQEGIFGSFWLHSGGAINLTNDAIVDLNGFLHIYGGVFNIQGTGGVSYFSYLANSGIEMSGGTLDFKNVGIGVINGGFAFSENITGGTIKTVGDADIQRTEFSPSGGTLELYGQAGSFLSLSNGAWLHNLIINKTAGISMVAYSNLDVNGDLTIASGTLDSWSFNINVAGNLQNSVGAQGFDPGTGSVIFDGNSPKTITGAIDFYDIQILKTWSGYNGITLSNVVMVQNNLTITDGCIEMDSPSSLMIGGNLFIAPGAGLNANDPYGAQIMVAKNWTDLNPGYTASSGFSSQNSTVSFIGETTQTLITNAVEGEFHHLKVDKASGSFRSEDNLAILGNLQIINGCWEDNVAGLTHKITGNFSLSPEGYFNTITNGNTIEFTGSGNSALLNNSAASVFRNLKINKANGSSVTQYGIVDLLNNGNLTIQQGRFVLNESMVSVSGNVAVNATGTLHIGPSGALSMRTHGKNINIHSGGKLELSGTSASPAIIGITGDERWYNLTVNSGGAIAADYGIFTNPGINGINIASGASVDTLHAFTGCTFQNGFPGGTLLTINNDQELTILNAVFPSNSFGSASNVTKTTNAGHVTFVGYNGPFSGEAYDHDPHNLIEWIQPLVATVSATPPFICPGGSSQLDISVTGGAPGYSYLWSPASGLSNTAISNPVATPLSTCVYEVTVTDAFGSTSIAAVVVSVLPASPVSVSISASANPSPPDSLVVFTATPVNGGVYPEFQWKVNGVNAGTDTFSFSYIPNNHDFVSCEMTSSELCPSGNPATSNTIIMELVDLFTVVSGNIPAMDSECYDAFNTITIGGEATPFTIQNGGSATMIAGQKILYLPGTSVFSGGYLHGYITTDNTYCGNLMPVKASVQTGTTRPEQQQAQTSLFTIFPNPARDKCTLMYKGELTEEPIIVEILDMQGTTMMRDQMTGERSIQFRLGNYPSGLYLMKVNVNHRYESLKMIISK